MTTPRLRVFSTLLAGRRVTSAGLGAELASQRLSTPPAVLRIDP